MYSGPTPPINRGVWVSLFPYLFILRGLSTSARAIGFIYLSYISRASRRGVSTLHNVVVYQPWSTLLWLGDSGNASRSSSRVMQFAKVIKQSQVGGHSPLTRLGRDCLGLLWPVEVGCSFTFSSSGGRDLILTRGGYSPPPPVTDSSSGYGEALEASFGCIWLLAGNRTPLMFLKEAPDCCREGLPRGPRCYPFGLCIFL